LTGKQIATARYFRGITLPEGIDFTDASFTEKDISGIDFSKAKNLTGKQIATARYFRGITLPEGIDFTDASFTEKDISEIDFSKVKNLTWSQIAEAKELREIILPEGMDFTGVSFTGKDIFGIDFSKVKNLTWEQIAEAWYFRKIKLPGGMDFTGVSFTGKDILGIDFSKVKNLTWSQIAEAKELREIILPEGMDFTGVSFTGKDIFGIDFSKVKNLTWEQIAEAWYFRKIKLPGGMDFTGVSFTGKDILGIDFSKVKNLTWSQIAEAKELRGIILPEGMDFTGESCYGNDIFGVDFSKVKNLTWSQIAGARELRRIRLPEGMDFTGVSFTGKDISEIDFSKAKNLTWKQIQQANRSADIVFPIDTSTDDNFAQEQISNEQGLPPIKLPVEGESVEEENAIRSEQQGTNGERTTSGDVMDAPILCKLNDSMETERFSRIESNSIQDEEARKLEERCNALRAEIVALSAEKKREEERIQESIEVWNKQMEERKAEALRALQETLRRERESLEKQYSPLKEEIQELKENRNQLVALMRIQSGISDAENEFAFPLEVLRKSEEAIGGIPELKFDETILLNEEHFQKISKNKVLKTEDIRTGLLLARALGNTVYILSQPSPKWFEFKDFWREALKGIWESAHANPDVWHVLLIENFNIASPDCWGKPLWNLINGWTSHLPCANTPTIPDNLRIIVSVASCNDPDSLGLPTKLADNWRSLDVRVKSDRDWRDIFEEELPALNKKAFFPVRL